MKEQHPEPTLLEKKLWIKKMIIIFSTIYSETYKTTEDKKNLNHYFKNVLGHLFNDKNQKRKITANTISTLFTGCAFPCTPKNFPSALTAYLCTSLITGKNNITPNKKNKNPGVFDSKKFQTFLDQQDITIINPLHKNRRHRILFSKHLSSTHIGSFTFFSSENPSSSITPQNKPRVSISSPRRITNDPRKRKTLEPPTQTTAEIKLKKDAPPTKKQRMTTMGTSSSFFTEAVPTRQSARIRKGVRTPARYRGYL